jgi:voltage-gated potassium channel Kch
VPGEARRANPDLEIVARAHFDVEVEHLSQLGADVVIMGERVIALTMLQEARKTIAAETPAGAPVNRAPAAIDPKGEGDTLLAGRRPPGDSENVG